MNNSTDFIQVGSWALYYDSFSKEKVMVKIVDKNEDNKTAVVLLNLVMKRGEKPQQYRMEVQYEELSRPQLKAKQKRIKKSSVI